MLKLRSILRKKLRRHCTKNEVFHYGFLQQIWDLVTFTEEFLIINFIFCAV